MQVSFNNSNDFTSEENLRRLTTGVILLAKDTLQDPNFDSTIVLVCAFSKDGAYGLVLNRLCHMPLSEIFDGLSGLNLKREIFIGGPVQQHELQIVQLTDTPVDDALVIAPHIYMGGKWENAIHMIESDPDSTRLFLGYSGWAAGQLEAEIEAGAWDVYQVNLEKLLSETRFAILSSSHDISNYLKTFI